MRRVFTKTATAIFAATLATFALSSSALAQDASDTSAVLGALGENYADADLANGARQYRRCQACHTIDAGGANRAGPNLHGVMDSPAAQVEGFAFSTALTDSGLIWDAATMDSWLENPRALVPGNRMSFAGLRDADARRDLIAHIAVESSR
jgi:cytochrome c